MAKKDFSKVKTNNIYDMRQEATEPLPGQIMLDGTEEEPGTDPEDEAEAAAAASTMQQSTLQVKGELPEELADDMQLRAAVERRKAAQKEIAELQERKRKRAQEANRKNKPRAGKLKLYHYITPDALEYLNFMSAWKGTTRQDLLEQIILEKMQNDTEYNELMKVRKGNK